MNLPYLAEQADPARVALELAEREAGHLQYTYRTLYAEPIDIAWVEALVAREDLAEKIDAFIRQAAVDACSLVEGQSKKDFLAALACYPNLTWMR